MVSSEELLSSTAMVMGILKDEELGLLLITDPLNSPKPRLG